MIVLHARPSPGFREAVDAVFGPGVVVHVDEAAPLDEVAGEITALLHVLTPVTGDFIASAPKLKLIQKLGRSEERRVGEECVSTCRTRWSPTHSKKKNTSNYKYTYNI